MNFEGGGCLERTRPVGGANFFASEAGCAGVDVNTRGYCPPFAKLVMRTITTYRKSGRFFILRVMVMLQQQSC